MTQVRWASWLAGAVVVIAALTLCGARPTTADVRSDEAAAILVWPDIIFFGGEGTNSSSSFEVVDTVIQLSNTSTDPVFVHCFYENANSHCSNTGEVCEEPEDCCNTETGCGFCTPGWNETDFHLQITPRQPLGWRAGEGMAGFDPTPPNYFGTFPIDGVHNFGLDGTSSNAGSRIPPVPENPFTGALRCIAVDQDDVPVDSNVLKGEESPTGFIEAPEQPIDGLRSDITVAKGNAIGIQAIPGAVNDDNVLVLGGPDAEYNGCPNFLILDHFFDGAENPVIPSDMVMLPTQPIIDIGTVFTSLILVPCTQNYQRQIPGSAVVQYLVYNEFEQRFSTSRPMKCYQDIFLSNIDTTQNERSIFSAGIAGTLTGQTRINPIGSGLLGVAFEEQDSGFFFPAIAEFNLQYQGDRSDSDLITLP